jgi:hypothetical protein
MGVRRSQVVEKEKSCSWLIETERSQGKWNDYTARKSKKHSQNKESSHAKWGTIEGGGEGNRKRRQSGGCVGRGGRTGSRRVD